ncbi:ABC transporter permease subunit [Thermocatellispora tengchongensis]|uniref:ABC transporter permease subunit n=1 Tax=Thermocatellispora tengchongensis TaxID=1073253 RepID=UPI00364291EE
MIAAFSVLTPAGTFLSLSNFESVLLTASQLLILSCGTTFLLIAGGLDLSIGAVTVFSAVVVAKVMGALAGTAAQAADFQYPNLAVAVAAAVEGGLAVGLGWGVLNGVLAVRTRIPRSSPPSRPAASSSAWPASGPTGRTSRTCRCRSRPGSGWASCSASSRGRS